MTKPESQIRTQTRRAFLRHGSLLLLGAGVGSSSVDALFAEDAKRRVRLGMVTDLHYADKLPARSRHYREALAKLAEAAEQFGKDQPDLVVCLGDLIDSADSVKAERGFLTRINKDFAALPGKKQFLESKLNAGYINEMMVGSDGGLDVVLDCPGLEEKNGNLVHDVAPNPKKRSSRSNEGSDNDLGFHNEVAVSEHRPDHLALLCLKSDREGKAVIP